MKKTKDPKYDRSGKGKDSNYEFPSHDTLLFLYLSMIVVLLSLIFIKL